MVESKIIFTFINTSRWFIIIVLNFEVWKSLKSIIINDKIATLDNFNAN